MMRHTSLTRTFCLSWASCPESGWQLPTLILPAGSGMSCASSGHHSSTWVGFKQAILCAVIWKACPWQRLHFRYACLQVLAWAVEKKPKQLTKQNLVRPLLHMLLKMTTEPDEGEKEDDEDDEDAPPRKLASQVETETVLSADV